MINVLYLAVVVRLLSVTYPFAIPSFIYPCSVFGSVIITRESTQASKFSKLTERNCEIIKQVTGAKGTHQANCHIERSNRQTHKVIHRGRFAPSAYLGPYCPKCMPP